METKALIPAEIFCLHHKIEITFLLQLQDNNLIVLSEKETQYFILEEEVTILEKMVRLHQDLQLNAEGIATTLQLLERIKELESKLLAQNMHVPFETED